MMRFKDHKYEWSKPFMSIHHAWSLRGPRGGIHFHASLTPEYAPSCGLEFHRDFDPSGGADAASHKNCWLTGGKCWHNGTSLYASEHLWPMIKMYLDRGDHESTFRILEQEYNEHFARFSPAPIPEDE